MISAEDLDAAGAERDRARWNLQQTTLTAPTDSWITNLTLRPGKYATVGSPLFALVDSYSYYVIGYFEETKLRHIHPDAAAQVVLYSNGARLQGQVDSIDRAIYDQSIETDSGLGAGRQAQRPLGATGATGAGADPSRSAAG